MKQFTQSSNKGFTLLELLVTLVVASVITGLALKLIVDQRQLFLNDQSRTQVNQNLRASLDLVGADIKQAGERLTTSTLPVVRVINGSATDPNVPDELVLQRLVIAESLPVCKTVTTGTTTSEIEVSQKGGAGLCNASFSSPTATLPITLNQWKDSRCAKDGTSACARAIDVNRATVSNRCVEEKDGTDKECVWAYIYDPDTNRGEFFLYGFESPKDTPDTPTNAYRVHRVDGEAWKNTYPYGVLSSTNPTNPTLYILEQRRYRLKDNVLELILNEQIPPPSKSTSDFLVDNQTSPIRLVNQLSNFQVKALMQSGNTPLTREDFNNTAIDDWKQLKAIKIDVTAINPAPNSTKVPNLTVSAQFFPRNVSSK
ncbi:hypothetical protein UH38_07270 [Aliterella atlantica CENA595]|uniref:Prepilin-type N-terminal cleavage/methylation domain-containing protein n=1 Tax=Aliterella atlantica CENA595 TaxID=1618023 RepID=A0A0D8ZU39_9CYAN|nr:hypothetical protein UH38_07270 [Aliterella atlantica CENA595]